MFPTLLIMLRHTIMIIIYNSIFANTVIEHLLCARHLPGTITGSTWLR